jgi:aspartate racemase
VALGYHKRRVLNEERFIPHPWRTGAKLYATGDLVRTTERGNYVYVDRVDHQVKVRGFRVELGEIEARLRQHPSVREAAVVVQQRGGSVPRLVGFVESESDLAPRSLREHVAAALPPYMVPTHLIVDQELPKTSAGKIDRQALAARDLNQQQEDRQPESECDPLELALLEIWSDILGVTVRDSPADFFDLGGNSLLALNLFAVIERRFNKAVNPVAFFRTPTLVHLAEMIRTSAGDESRTPLLRLVVGSPGVRPLFFTPGVPGRGFHYVHLAQALDATIPVYSLQVRGLRTGEIPHSDTLAAARDYANWIQEVQPKGPYALTGFSAGCIVAIAVADVLLQRGERLDFVGLIDGVPPTTIRFPTPLSSPQRFARFARTTVDRVREILKRPDAPQALWWRGRSAARRVMARWLPGMAHREISVDDLFIGSGVRFTKRDWQLMQAHLSMLMHYKPDPVALDIVLFRSLLDPFEGPYEADLGWSRLVTGRIAIEVFGSRHRDLLGASGAPELGKRINRYLQQRRR